MEFLADPHKRRLADIALAPGELPGDAVVPRLGLRAKRNIHPDEEIVVFYGEEYCECRAK